MTKLKDNISKKIDSRKNINKKIRNSTIMSDIFRSILFPSFFLLIIFITLLGYYVYQRNIKHSISMLEEENKSISAELDQYFKNILTTIDVLSYSPELIESTQSEYIKDKIKNVLTRIESNDPIINRIFVAYEDSTLLINDSIFPEDYILKDAKWYNNAIKSQRRTFSVDNIPTLEKDYNPKFIISKSFSHNGVKLGTIAIDCQLDYLYSVFSSKSMFKTKEVMLANAQDQIVLSENPDKIDQFTVMNHFEMFTEKSISFPIKYDGEKYLVFSNQLSDPDWNIISRITYSEINSTMLPRMLIFGLVLLFLMFIISKVYAYALGKTIAKPVLDVSFALNNLAKGNRNINPIADYPQNEIGLMAESFNTFLETTKLLKSDIYELNETKDKLSYSLSLLNASLESTDDGLIIIDLESIITKWNDRFLDIWGETDDFMETREDDIILTKLQDKIVDYKKFCEIINKAKKDAHLITQDIVYLKNGKILERYSFPQKIEDTVVGRVWRYRDITKIRESEILLEDSEERHRVMFTQTVDAYCILDNEVFTEVNHAAQEMIKAPNGWLISKTPYDISPKYQQDGRLSEECAVDYIKECNEKGKITFDWLTKAYDGTIFPAQTTLIKINLKGKNLFLAIWKDMTEEKKIAEKLRTNEQNFRLFFESMEEMIFIIDVEGKIKHVNRSAEEKMGYSFAELTSMNVLQIHDNQEDFDLLTVMDYLKKKNDPDRSLSLKTKEGSLISVESKTWLGKWNGEESLFGISKDISKEQEALLKFNKIFENNPALMAISSYPEKKFINVNNSFCKTLGYTKEEVIGKVLTDIDVDFDLVESKKSFDELLNEANFTNVQVKASTNTGKIIDGLLSGELIEATGNKFYLHVLIDITDMKNLDRKLNESNRKYHLLFENMTTGFALHEMIYDENGKPIDYRFLDVNPAFEQYVGMKSDQLLGRTVKEVFPETEDYWIEAYGRVAKTGVSLNYEHFSHEFGKYFDVKAFTSEPNKFATIFYDTTPKVEALQDLEKEKELAQTATKAKSEFLANMSHEIRTPLNGVIGFTDLLLSTELSSSQKQFAVNANVSGKALLGIISDILDFSKIEAGKMELDLVNSPITEILEQAVDIIKFSASKKDLDVILNIPVDFPEKALVDPLRLKQILLNLLNNAVKFTNEGEVQLTANFIPQNNSAGRFIFKVKDTGVGISETASKRLFKAFSQADGSITRKYGGTGLGLVISNYFAAKMGSHIDFESEEGHGSEFYFAIDTDYVEQTLNLKDVFKGNKVLFADKNSNLIDVLSKRLHYWGIESTFATNYETIKRYLKSDDFEAIFIDERLIDKDDYQAFKEITSAGAKKKAIIVTYYPNDNLEIIKLSKLINATHMLTKPLIINDLFDCLKGICTSEIPIDNTLQPIKKAIAQLETDKNIKVLIAEDVEMNMILIKTLIKKIIPQVEILEAKNGMEAVYFYKEHSPDIVLMDIQMPELDGLEATKAIKRIELSTGKNIPIIALTAGAFSDDREKCIKAGMVDFLTKPINVKELTEKLVKYIEEDK